MGGTPILRGRSPRGRTRLLRDEIPGTLPWGAGSSEYAPEGRCRPGPDYPDRAADPTQARASNSSTFSRNRRSASHIHGRLATHQTGFQFVQVRQSFPILTRQGLRQIAPRPQGPQTCSAAILRRGKSLLDETLLAGPRIQTAANLYKRGVNLVQCNFGADAERVRRKYLGAPLRGGFQSGAKVREGLVQSCLRQLDLAPIIVGVATGRTDWQLRPTSRLYRTGPRPL